VARCKGVRVRVNHLNPQIEKGFHNKIMIIIGFLTTTKNKNEN